MNGDEPAGVAFPASADGRRSTSALGQAVVADALARVDPAGALDVGRETNWRTGYPTHFRRLIEAGLASKEAALSVARDGLAALHRRMRVVGRDGAETGLDALLSASARCVLTTVTVAGTGAAESELTVPYRGERLSGQALMRRLEAWVAAGVIEPSCAEAVRAVSAHPQWLALPGRTVVALGAGAEVGPLPVLLNWGARVIGIDLARPVIWERVLEVARRSGGTLLIPVAHDKPGQDGLGARAGDDLAQRAGFDLTGDVAAVADWLVGIEGPLVLGNYVYADGAANVRVASAVDALTLRLQAERRDLTLGFLATPTDVFAVPADAVAQAARAYAARSPAAKLGSSPLRMLSGGRLLRPAYPAGADPGVCDGLVPQQGPNYALAKRLQALARHGRPGRRHHGVHERSPADPHPLGHEKPGASGGVRGRAPVRRRGVRTRYHQDAHGRPARPRPARGRRPRAGPPLARRSPGGRPRRPVAHRLRPAQRAGPRGPARLPRGQEAERVTRSAAA